MRIFSALLLASIPSCLAAANGSDSASLTVILDFDQPHSAESIDAMQRETAALFRNTGVHLTWQMRDTIGDHAEFRDLIFVKMKGHCAKDDYFMPVDERGPLGMSHTSAGEVLPFGEVDCDRIKTSLRHSVPASEPPFGDRLLGRAMGRVLAHEIYHMLAKEKHHTASGITRDRLSADDLTREDALFSPTAIESVAGGLHRK